MALEEFPEMPAQTHPVRFSPASLRGLSVWAYLALTFVIISTIGVLCYAAHSFYHSLTLNELAPLPQYSHKSRSKTKRTKKKAWRPSRSSSSQQQPMLGPDSLAHEITDQYDSRMSLRPLEHAADHGHIPPVAFPSPAVAPPLKSRTIPTYDMHNIRFASPSNVAIYTNPKLAPVVGSAIPLSYDSHNNLFANPFTPATSLQVGSGKTHTASFSSAFRSKTKSTSLSRVFGKDSIHSKENSNVAEQGLGEAVPLKRLY